MTDDRSPAYVYLYRDERGRPRYVGKGVSTSRAMAHPGRTDAFGQWLATGAYEIEVAGPYRDEQEALEVESALIAALRPSGLLFNVSPGNGHKLIQLGVPQERAERMLQPPLGLSDVGVATGGALIVFIRSLDLTTPDAKHVAAAASGTWQLNSRIHGWRDDPSSGPRVLVGVAGRRGHRFIAGAFAIDTAGWALPEHLAPVGRLWWVPLLNPAQPDACQLQGRRIDGITFGRAKSEHFRIVDGHGQIVHPAR